MEKKRLDVGHLLDTLTCLIDKDKGIILDFYENIFLKKSVIEDRQLLSKLKELLEDFFKVLFSS